MKELKDYQHLYLGMQVKVAGKEFINGGYIGELIGLMDEQTLLIEYMGDAWIDAKKCTPILRPLSDMTEEEAKEAYTIRGKNAFYEFEGETIKYLLSKHFDLFGLIEAGLAIDKTTLK